ncbi:hypothetical protein [Streptomyces sp. NPDC048340]|uniref:hypothetical protein n=1 Tax=Streptomyces sp. NPDC048340 TaxID=3365537 RepID=UPI00371E8C29
MTLAELTLAQWRTFDLATARRLAGEAAAQADGRVTLVETVRHLGAPLHRALIERDGREFALIPGGRVRLGFDLEAWRPTPEQVADYEECLAEGFACAPDLKTHLAGELSPPRTAEPAAVLMAVEEEQLTELPSDMTAVLAARGLRTPDADEWEHACGAGATTLFRWGDAYPLDAAPYGDGGDGRDGTGPLRERNAFGLRIAHDVYTAELSSGGRAVHGGDGGEAVCGGYGRLREWLPLATANTNPAMAEFVHGPDGEDAWDAFSVRPVLSLR